MFFGLFKLQPHCDPLLAVIGFFVYLSSFIVIGKKSVFNNFFVLILFKAFSLVKFYII